MGEYLKAYAGGMLASCGGVGESVVVVIDLLGI